jgi:hypothetical protein
MTPVSERTVVSGHRNSTKLPVAGRPLGHVSRRLRQLGITGPFGRDRSVRGLGIDDGVGRCRISDSARNDRSNSETEPRRSGCLHTDPDEVRPQGDD